jgi:hypothetical protein
MGALLPPILGKNWLSFLGVMGPLLWNVDKDEELLLDMPPVVLPWLCLLLRSGNALILVVTRQ